METLTSVQSVTYNTLVSCSHNQWYLVLKAEVSVHNIFENGVFQHPLLEGTEQILPLKEV